MAVFSKLIAYCSNDIIPSDIREKNSVLKGASAIAIASAISLAILGPKTIIILVGLLVVMAALKYEIFLLLLLFYTEAPAMILLKNYGIVYVYGITFLVIFNWLARKFIIPNSNVQYSKILLLFSLIFLFISAVSVLHGPLSRNEMEGFIKLIIFFTLINIIYDLYKPHYTVYFILSFVVPTFIMSMFLLARYLQTPDLLSIIMLYRNKGMQFYWTVNLNAFAALILLVLPFCWSIFLWNRRKWVKYLSGIVSILFTVALLLTAARAALVGFALITIVLLIWAQKAKYLLIPLAIGLIIIVMYPNILTLFTIALRFDAGTTGRSVIWSDMMTIIKNNFWFGTGVDSFGEQYLKYFSFNHWPDRVIPHDAHNQILDWVVRLGILGLPLVISVYYISIKNGITAVRKASNLEDKAIIIGIFGGLIAICGRSIFESGAFLLSGVFLFPAVIYWTFLIILMKINTYNELPKSGLFPIK